VCNRLGRGGSADTGNIVWSKYNQEENKDISPVAEGVALPIDRSAQANAKTSLSFIIIV